MTQLPIEVRILDIYTAADRLWLSGGNQDPSGTDDYHLCWRAKDLHVLVFHKRSLVSHVGLVKHSVRLGEEDVPVAGIGGVLTHPDYRGCGLGQTAMRRAEEHARDVLGISFGMLFCRPEMQPWYEAQGWLRTEVPVWVEQPDGIIEMPLPTLVKCFANQNWPPKAIQLRSCPW